MATIREVWIPSPHHSTSRGAYLKGAFHTTEGSLKIRDLGAWFQNPSAGCSSHHGSDNYERGLFGAYVYENHKAWTQGDGNSVCLSLEQCTPSGAASGWSRDTWLSKTILIDNAAEWMHYMAEKYKLPYKWLNNSETQDSWTKGFCEHVNGGSSWSGHHDCGNGFPNDVVMDKAKAWGSGSGGGTTPTTEADVSSSVAFYNGKQYIAYINPQNKVCVNGGVVDPGSNAKGGVGLAINQDNGHKTVSYTNTSNSLCTYEQDEGSGDWVWSNRGWDAK
jgi:hypothetical protein